MDLLEELNSEELDTAYTFLVNDVMKYIEKIKQVDRSATILDIIMDYARHKDIDVEIVGDAISSDVYLKSFIETDCKMNKIFRIGDDAKPLDEW